MSWAEHAAASNTVATPILTLNVVAVNKDLEPELGKIESGTDDLVVDNCLLMFDNIRTHSQRTGRPNADYSETTKSVGLHQELF